MNSTTSCVLVVSDVDLAQANRVINNFGYSGENFTVELKRVTDNSRWLGLHMWADQDFVDFMTELDPSVPSLFMSAVPSGNAQQNWLATLATNHLETLPEEV